ncbi:MAG: hypothetical protein GYB66_00765 [Chloroflexi bacterium]|nr:hypothetical protein [Chloroflexota bacterium]
MKVKILWLVGLLVVLVVVVGCGNSDSGDGDSEAREGDSSGEVNQTPTSEPSLTPPGTDTAVAGDGAPTASVSAAVTSDVPLVPTATLPYDPWRYAGDWGLNLRFEITGGGPFGEVDTWVYSGQATIRVTEDGNATGSGRIYTSPLDERCLVETFDSEGYGFTVTGSLAYDGERLWLEIELVPDDYFVIENYVVTCPDYTEARQISENYLWPMLGQIEKLEYRFWMDDSQHEIEFNEDLTARTNRVFRGAINGHLLLTR